MSGMLILHSFFSQYIHFNTCIIKQATIRNFKVIVRKLQQKQSAQYKYTQQAMSN